MLRKLVLTAAFAAALAPAAQAGSVAAPYMEPEIVVEEAASSSAAGWIVPLVFLAIIAIAASGSDFKMDG